MGALLNWDREDHFAVDHGFSGISVKTVQYCAGSLDTGFAKYPSGSLLCQFLNYDASDFLRLKKLRDSRAAVSVEDICKLLGEMPYYRDLMALLPDGKQRELAQQFSMYQRGILWQDAEICFQLIEDRYQNLIYQLYEEATICPGTKALQKLPMGALDSPALGLRLPKALTKPVMQYVLSESGGLAERYHASTLAELLYLDFIHLVQAESNVRRCCHCGRYFLPERGYNYRYCNDRAPGEERTCREIGAARTRQSKLEDNTILAEYQRCYKRYYARMLKQRWTREQFQTWQEQAIALRNTAEAQHWDSADFAQKLQNAADSVFSK